MSQFNPLLPRVQPWVTQSFLTFDSMDRTLKYDHQVTKLLSSTLLLCCVLFNFNHFVVLDSAPSGVVGLCTVGWGSRVWWEQHIMWRNYGHARAINRGLRLHNQTNMAVSRRDFVWTKTKKNILTSLRFNNCTMLHLFRVHYSANSKLP